MSDAPVDCARAQTAVGAAQRSRKYDQRLEVDRLPVVAPNGAIDAELCPQAPRQVEGEPVHLLAEACHVAGVLLFIVCLSVCASNTAGSGNAAKQPGAGAASSETTPPSDLLPGPVRGLRWPSRERCHT